MHFNALVKMPQTNLRHVVNDPKTFRMNCATLNVLNCYLAESSVPIISDVTSIHNLPKKISQIFPGYPVVGFQVVEQHVGADDQVASVEGIDLVPTLLHIKNKTIAKGSVLK